jgi:uncharacterized OB-fold protein
MSDIYEIGADGTVRLIGGICPDGHVHFPLQQLGCETCGAAGDAITRRDLSGDGVLTAAVTVTMRNLDAVPPPYHIGTVHLDDGPVIRALLNGEQRHGGRVTAMIADDHAGADSRFALRFSAPGER